MFSKNFPPKMAQAKARIWPGLSYLCRIRGIGETKLLSLEFGVWGFGRWVLDFQTGMRKEGKYRVGLRV